MLTGANGYAGTTTISQGTLADDSAVCSNNDNSIVFDGGTLQLGCSDSNDCYWQINSGKTAIIDTNGHDFTLCGGIRGNGGVEKKGAGTLQFAGENTYTGGTIVDAGTLDLYVSTYSFNGLVINGGTLHFSSGNATAGAVTLTNGSITGGSGNTLTADSYTVVSGTIGVNLAGAASLAKVSNGTVTLSGANTYTGLTTVYAGTLAVDGSDAWTPLLDSQNYGGVNLRGGTIVFAYTNYDPASTIQTLLHDSYNSPGGHFVSGAIHSSTAALATPTEMALGSSDNTTTHVVTVAYTKYGDANCDGWVNGPDLGAVLANLNQSNKNWSQGDFNYDGSVDGSDLGCVLANYNAQTTGQAPRRSISIGSARVRPAPTPCNSSSSSARASPASIWAISIWRAPARPAASHPSSATAPAVTRRFISSQSPFTARARSG